VEFSAPLCSLWDLDDVVVILKENSAIVAGRGRGGFEERYLKPEEVEPYVRQYVDLYDKFLSKIAEIIGSKYEKRAGNIVEWLKSHVDALNRMSAKWGKLADALGPFSLSRRVDAVYVPYVGLSITANYVAYPFPDAVIHAENRGETMAIGSVVVKWGGSTVIKVGIRTIAGAILLSQADAGLSQELGAINRALGEFVEEFKSIWRCQSAVQPPDP